jgi:phosphoribosylcarboxyaminoimidazole (NCAIR) mutase
VIARTLPYAPEREFEDLAALIDVAGGSAHLFGASSGGALAMLDEVEAVPAQRLDDLLGGGAVRHSSR